MAHEARAQPAARQLPSSPGTEAHFPRAELRERDGTWGLGREWVFRGANATGAHQTCNKRHPPGHMLSWLLHLESAPTRAQYTLPSRVSNVRCNREVLDMLYCDIDCPRENSLVALPPTSEVASPPPSGSISSRASEAQSTKEVYMSRE